MGDVVNMSAVHVVPAGVAETLAAASAQQLKNVIVVGDTDKGLVVLCNDGLEDMHIEQAYFLLGLAQRRIMHEVDRQEASGRAGH